MSRYNCENGGPAPERLTNAIYQNTTKIKEYWTAEESLSVDLDKLGTTQFMVQHQDGKFGPFAVEVQPCSTQPWSKPKGGSACLMLHVKQPSAFAPLGRTQFIVQHKDG